MNNLVKYEIKNQIALVTINRPEALNALNRQVLEELEEVVAAIEKDTTVRGVILTGEGRSFVAGADIQAQSGLDVEGGRQWGRYGSGLFRRIEKLPIPTIAAVNGFALGGGLELALAFDMIVASEKAKFGAPEVSLGITPGYSCTQRLPRRVGVHFAKEMIFTGSFYTAQDALRMGLVNHVCPPDALLDKAFELAAACVKNAPAALRSAKECIDQGLQTDLVSGIAIENELFALCFGTSDQKEGMAAFLEKRPAVFTGK